MLDDLGLAPSGSPIPPTAFYSVIHYPEERLAPAGEALEHFMFIVPEGATSEEEKKTESLLGVPVVPEVKVPGQGLGWMGRWNGKGSLRKGSEDMMGHCVCRHPFCCPKETALLETWGACMRRETKNHLTALEEVGSWVRRSIL